MAATATNFPLTINSTNTTIITSSTWGVVKENFIKGAHYIHAFVMATPLRYIAQLNPWIMSGTFLMLAYKFSFNGGEALVVERNLSKDHVYFGFCFASFTLSLITALITSLGNKVGFSWLVISQL